MRKLEEFIRNNRKKIDLSDPPNDLWDKIETRLDAGQRKKKIARLRVLIGIAALLFVTLISGLIFFKNTEKQRIDLSSINADLAVQEVHYKSLIQDKQIELSYIKQKQPDLYKEFCLVLDTVEENYRQLKNSLPSSPNQQETLRAMVINLEVQMTVLNQQLNVIRQLNQSKNESQYEINQL